MRHNSEVLQMYHNNEYISVALPFSQKYLLVIPQLILRILVVHIRL